MTDYDVGYGKPPKETRFKSGASGNPKGRPRRRSIGLPDIIERTLSAPVTYKEGGRVKSATRSEIALKKTIIKAMNGDISAADLILERYEHTQRQGNAAGTIEVENSWPDPTDQSAAPKTQEFTESKTPSDPTEWWSERPQIQSNHRR